MDDIARLLADLAAGYLTAAVPLIDLFTEAGMKHEAASVASLVGEAREMIGNALYRDGDPKRHQREIRQAFRADLLRCFWHLMPDEDRDAALEADEEWLLGEERGG